MDKLSDEKYFEILSELDTRHGVFYHLWDMGSPIFTDNIPTAGVVLSKDGECINFLLNQDFWESLNLEQRLFVLCHECLHVVLNHGHRLFKNAENKEDFKVMNFATDVVINHTLVNKFNFDMEEIDPHGKYCWTHTVFPKEPDLEQNKSSEFYYNKFYDNIEKNNKMPHESAASNNGSDGEGENFDPQTVDDHSTFIPEENNDNSEEQQDMSNVLKELDERLTDDEKEFIQDLIDSNEDLDNRKNSDKSGKDAGNSPGNIFTKVDVKKVKKKKKWETVIKKWANKYIKNTEKEETQWARTNRRFQLISNNNMFLPSEMEQEDIAIEEKRIEVWFFQDTSGSCSGYRQRFFDAARSLPPDRFDVKMHCFDTRVYEIDIERGELMGFGGTRFNIIENYIQKDISDRDVPYPKAVFIITDGFGNNVNPEKEENWYWFLTPNGTKSWIPKKSHIFNLKDFE
jgi:hypothetical protein